MNIKGKVVLITGASTGIGRATAIAFAKRGASVLINYKSGSKNAKEVLKECNKYSTNNNLFQADISQEYQVKRMFENIKSTYKSLDILINNAAIFDEEDTPKNLEVFNNIYKTNFFGPFTVTKYALSVMNKGKIVNVSSVHGRVGYGRPEIVAYSAFKAALNSYTKNLAKYLAPNILVNAVAPGRVATPMWGDLSEEEKKELGTAHAIKRMIEPNEVAHSILFLVENDAMCGEILTIDGGYTLLNLN